MLDDAELDAAFSKIKDAGIRVVRTWAFNDVSQKPATGTYFQVCLPYAHSLQVPFDRGRKILKDGKATINQGADGLQRLDKLVGTAEKYGLKLILTLTNNWNPERPQPAASVARRDNEGFPRGFLSNDYGMYSIRGARLVADDGFAGGMDMYVRAFHPGGTHDLFYTDPTIVNAFKTYVSKVVPHFANSSTILAWELANDPRCSSTLPASPQCNTRTITKWVADLGSYHPLLRRSTAL
jgi:mannan endo-1,4-beta-mannosidase